MDFLDLALLLFAIALIAGLIDAIAGGGGLITVPALLWAGLPPIEALATNKGQGVFGSLSASLHFIRRGYLDLRSAALAVACTFIGAAAGAWLVQSLPTDLLSRLIPVLLIAFALYFVFSPRVGDLDSQQRIPQAAFALLIGTAIGFYDGFFGPGTGSFFAIAFVALLGYNLRRATANAKLLNFTSNLAALLFFTLGGQVVWTLALVMGTGQLIGGWLGAHLAIKHGAALIRPLLAIGAIATSIKLLLD